MAMPRHPIRVKAETPCTRTTSGYVTIHHHTSEEFRLHGSWDVAGKAYGEPLRGRDNEGSTRGEAIVAARLPCHTHHPLICKAGSHSPLNISWVRGPCGGEQNAEARTRTLRTAEQAAQAQDVQRSAAASASAGRAACAQQPAQAHDVQRARAGRATHQPTQARDVKRNSQCAHGTRA